MYMAKLNIPRGRGGAAGKKEKTFVRLKLVVEISLQKSTHVLSGGSKTKSPPHQAASPSSFSFFQQDEDEDEHDHYVNDGDESDGGSTNGDCGGVVKEGHFAVIARTEEGEVKRFVVPLTYLEYPPFMRLLKEAEEEYGFGCDGVLTVPCHPTEFQKLLSHQQPKTRRRRASGSFLLNRITNRIYLFCLNLNLNLNLSHDTYHHDPFS